ncbi:MAG: hypothetical protein U0270_36485 [Labilithrix sp.]
MRWSLQLLVLAMVAACGDPVAAPPPPVPAPAPITKSESAPATPAPPLEEAPAPAGPVPKLLVRGFGSGSSGLVEKMRSFDTFKELLEKEGFDASNHAHDLGDYDDGKPLADMASEVATKIEAVMAGYPAGTKFDVLGHSLGGIVLLHAVLDHGLAPRVRTFVALSSPIYGQDDKPLNCKVGFRCSDVYAMYSPYRSDQVVDYMTKSSAALSGMKRCSLISPDDGIIDAPMAGGQFPDGANVVVADVSHIAIIRSAEAVAALKTECFDGAF